MPTRQAFRTTQSASLSAFSTSAPRRTRVAILGLGAGGQSPPSVSHSLVRSWVLTSSLLRIGGIGQPLSLLLKTDPLVSSLILYDIRGVPSVAAGISHIDVSGQVSSLFPFSLSVLRCVGHACRISSTPNGLLAAGMSRIHSSSNSY